MDRSVGREELAAIGDVLRSGGLVAFPTETVYGIAVAAENVQAVERLYAIKRRPRDKPMTMMVRDIPDVTHKLARISRKALALMERHWPGPLTLVLPSQVEGHPFGAMVGFRWPAHTLARKIVDAAGVPLYVPSANVSGQPAATTADEVLAAFPHELDIVVDGGPAEGGVASTVVRVVDENVEILREGAIPRSRIENPTLSRVLFVCTGNTDRSPLLEALMKRRLAEHLGCAESELRQEGFDIQSAGLAATPGRRASRQVRAVARDMFSPPLNLDLHRARKVSQSMLEHASRVYCMERQHRDEILAFFPHRIPDIYLVDPEGGDIDDPAGHGRAAFERTARRLDAAAALLVALYTRTS